MFPIPSCFIDSSQSMPSQHQGAPCSQEDFMEDVVAQIPSSWYLFGIFLGIGDGKLRAIEQNYPHNQLRCFCAVYSIWKEENLKPLTWEVVVKILGTETMSERALSLRLAEKYNVQV